MTMTQSEICSTLWYQGREDMAQTDCSRGRSFLWPVDPATKIFNDVTL